MTDSPACPAARALAPALLLAASLAPPAGAATLAVGPGQQYATVTAAVAAARDGDVVQVRAGTYTDDLPTVCCRATVRRRPGR